MPLPILNVTAAATPRTLIRLFNQTERDYVRHLGEETQLDFGTAFHNATLRNVHDANCVLDAFVPFLSPFRTFYIGLGTIASDLVLLLVITGILRKRFTANGNAWRRRALLLAA